MGKTTKRKPKPPTPKAAPQSATPRKGWLVRTVVLLLLAVTGLLLLNGWGRWLWGHVSPFLQTTQEYRLDPQTIVFQPAPPSWVRGDLRAQVLKGAGWEEPLSMLDPHLPQRIADAFEFHPWIEQAEVTLAYPAKVNVLLTYRKPVAHLKMDSHAGEDLVVLDHRGHRLPHLDLTAKEVAALPLLSELTGLHVPLVGQRAEGPQLLGAVEIASVLVDDWSSLEMAKLTPQAVLQGDDLNRYQVYQLADVRGQVYVWGAAPSQAPNEEASPLVKLARLRSAVQTARGRETASAQPVDLRLSDKSP